MVQVRYRCTMNSPLRPQFCRCWWERIPPTWLIICAAIVVQIGFGLYPVILRKFAAGSDHQADPIVFSFYRDALCFPLLFLCSFVAERKFLVPKLPMLFVFLILGLLGMYGSQLLYILGVYKAGGEVASAFQPIIPVWTAILAIVTCTEKVPSPYTLHTWMKVVAILLAVGGAIELTLTGGKTGSGGKSSQSLLGYLSLFGNTACMALYVLVQKRFIFSKPNCKWRDYPVAVTAYSYFFGALFMGVTTIYFAASGQTDKFKIPQQSLYALVFAIFITSALCYILITWTNVYLPASIVTAFWPVQVLVAVVFSFLINGEKLKPWQYVGVVMIISGLFFLLFSNYMDEQMAVGKKVIRLDDCSSARSKVPIEGSGSEEKQPLLDSHNGYTNDLLDTKPLITNDKAALN